MDKAPEAAVVVRGRDIPARGRSEALTQQKSRASRRPDQLTGGRHGLSASEVATSQRERILRATTSAVGEHGYQGTRIADVVWRAGVSRKTFYELFASKEECFAATYERQIDRLLEVTLDAYGDDEAKWADRLRSALDALLSDLASEPDIARLCFVEAIAAGDAVARRRDAAMQAFASLFDTPEARARPLAETVRMGRVGELSEVLRREIVAGRTRRLPELLPDLTYSMVLPFLGADAAKRELDRARSGRR